MLEVASLLGIGTLLYFLMNRDGQKKPSPSTPAKPPYIIPTNPVSPTVTQNIPETSSPDLPYRQYFIYGTEKLFGTRHDPLLPFELFYKDEKGELHSMGSNYLKPKDPYSLFTFTGPIDLVEADKIGDTSKIEKATTESENLLRKAYFDFLDSLPIYYDFKIK